MIWIWLDDERKPPNKGWTWVQTPEEAIAALKTKGVSRMSLDHDLGLSDRRTGYAVLLWLEEAVACHGFTPPFELTVHSANTSARPKMQAAIEQIYKLAGRA
jgi:hypothetical protein